MPRLTCDRCGETWKFVRVPAVAESLCPECRAHHELVGWWQHHYTQTEIATLVSTLTGLHDSLGREGSPSWDEAYSEAHSG